jgi:alkylhydroperoxidase/carboxymuconolactone decarboxylase family protein YurZ
MNGIHIAKHIDGAVMAGATKEEILDACMLAVIMGGGPKLMYMNIVYEELEKYF